MIQHFLKIFLRISLKSSPYSFINIIGLVLGMTTFTLMGLYVWHEKSFDEFHIKKNQIFRVRQDRYSNGELNRQWSGGPMGIGVDLKNNFSEVQRFVRLHRGVNEYNVISNEDKIFREDDILFASEDFFKIFSFPLTKGVDSLVLRDPFTMVVSASFAKKYFGDEDPIGRTLRCNGKDDYSITGVFQDLPDNSHLKFDALFSFESLFKILGKEETNELLSNWGWVGTYTYIELNSKSDARDLHAKLPAFVEKKMGATLREWNEGMTFVLQPINSIHLYSNTPDELRTNGNGQTINFLTLIAVFILVIAWINYINMATAKSMERAREVGIRKVLGGVRSQLIKQFLFESFIYKLVALIITVLLVGLLLPSFSALVDRKLDVNIFMTLKVWFFIVLIVVLGVIVSGLYPAIVISGFVPIKTLKGKFQHSLSGAYLRKGLVTFQFVSSIILIIGALVVYKQIQFMRTSPTGIDIEQVLVINGPAATDSTYANKLKALSQSLLQYPGIKSIVASTDVPGHHVRNTSGNVRIVGQDVSKGNSYEAIMTNENFINTYSLSLIAGRNFSGNLKDQWRTAVVNETAMKLLGINEPDKILGQKIYLWGDTPEIIGVVKDYHQESLKESVKPLVLVYDTEATNFYSLKLKSDASVNDVINVTQAKYREVFPDYPFRYFFADDHYNEQYNSDQQFGKIILLFTILSVTIACIGLLGLSSYLVLQRTKEIGIRKVLGARARQILVLVSKEFIVTILLANMIAWPLVYFIADDWLSEFAYRTQLELLDFIIPGFAILLVAILTIGTQCVKASNVDPVKNLRTD
jgi:putative ABC transport system permease protein